MLTSSRQVTFRTRGLTKVYGTGDVAVHALRGKRAQLVRAKLERVIDTGRAVGLEIGARDGRLAEVSSGLSERCGMANLLQTMPWNRPRSAQS